MTKKVALIGNPNVGKTTLFNTLTGAKQRAVNAPGTTVSVEVGTWSGMDLIDLPGLISFYHISPDEEVATNAIMHEDDSLRPDVAVLVADALHLSRALYLLSQVKASGLPIILAVTMIDIAARHKIDLDKELLKEVSGVQDVVFLDARSGEGTDDLKQAVLDAPKSHTFEPVPDPKTWAKERSRKHFEWVKQAEARLGLHKLEENSFSHKIDALLLNKFFGIAIFVFLMFLVFQLVTTISSPFIDLIDGNLRDLLTVDGDNLLVSFYNNAVLETAITVLSFLPPMFFMFTSLAFLEGSGYMSRAAFVADRVMKLIGLDGRALLPIIIGFGCNLPAVTGTRILQHSHERRALGYLIPFTLCSARLAVFVVLAHAFFPDYAGLVIFGLYIISIAAIILIGLAIKVVTRAKVPSNPFIISLPHYQVPLILPLFRSVGVKLLQFIKEAGTVIGIVIVLLFFLQNVPLANTHNQDGSDTTFAQIDDVHNSYYGFLADSVSPVFAPLGLDNWHFSSALITGFVAKEVVVSSLQNAYGVDNSAENGDDELGSKLSHTLDNSSNGHRTPAAIAFLVFILLYTPCVATIAGIKREFGGKFALRSVCLSLSVAYLLGLAIFQIGGLF